MTLATTTPIRLLSSPDATSGHGDSSSRSNSFRRCWSSTSSDVPASWVPSRRPMLAPLPG